MKRMSGRRRSVAGIGVVVGALAVFLFVMGTGGTSAALTGASAQKFCQSPTKIGDPVICNYAFINQDDFGNDETVTSLVDVSTTAAGPLSSGNILSSVGLIFEPTPNSGTNPNASPSCVGGSGAGTEADPYIGATKCTVPVSIVTVFGTNFTVGARIRTANFSWYTAQPGDYNLPGHALTDQDDFTWQCKTGGGSSCDVNANNHAQAPAQTTVIKRVSQTATDIHNAQHQVVTAVPVGGTVHDFVKVSSSDPDPSQPVPSGNVNVDWYLNGDCSGNPAANSGSIGPLDSSGHFDATGFAFTVPSAGLRSFKAHYEGDSVYLPSDGACEPLHVVDANITITPDATNEVGTTHTFTVTVNADDGTGMTAFESASVTTSIANSNGATGHMVGGTCGNTSGLLGSGATDANGKCTIVISSPTAGKTTANASASLTVLGVPLTRDTDPATASIGAGPGGSGPAVKTWVDANITIAPDATNEVGHSHTFTVTVKADAGDGKGLQPAAGATVSTSIANSKGATGHMVGGTCGNTSGLLGSGTTDASGQCTIVISSPTAGKTTANASANVSVGGLSLTRDTDPATASIGAGPGGSGPAMKTWVDANITITPDATNEVGHSHTFTVTVKADAGDGNGLQPVAGATVSTSIAHTNGATGQMTGGTCGAANGTSGSGTTDASGQCTIVISSPTAGKTTANASASLTVGGVALTRDTDPATASIGAGPGGSGPAVKTWVDANITIAPDATNEVGKSHTFTVTVKADAGDGKGLQPVAGASVSSSIANTNGATGRMIGGTCGNTNGLAGGGTTDANGQCTIVISSPTAGKTTANASVSLTVGGVALTRDTDPATEGIGAGPNGSGPAVKTWVDANIRIVPDATNEVGTTHTFTVSVKADAGDGDGLQPAAGVTVSTSIANSNGANAHLVGGTCGAASGSTGSGTTDANGECTLVITSAVSGKTTANASVTLTVGGVTLTRDTSPATADIGSGPGGSGPAVKTWADGNITIAPDATNEVGHSHTFTVTVKSDDGDGTGLQPIPGATVTTSIVNSNGATAQMTGGTCGAANGTTGSGTTDASGQCTIVISGPTGGKTTANASATFTVGGVTLKRDTDPATNVVAGPGGSGPAVKTWVDANIQITPNGVNHVGQNHTFTAHVNVNTGDGTGYVPAPDGTQISFTIDSGPGSPNPPTGCTTTGGTGSCTTTISSSTTGVTTVSAHTVVAVGGLALTRNTDGAGANSGPAVKTWVNARISIAPNATNEIGHSHTFTVTLEKDTGTGTFVPAAGEHVDVTLTDSAGANHAAPTGTCLAAGANTNASGQCTITFVSNTAGKVTGHATSTLSVAGSAPFTVATDGVAPNSGDAVKTFVDANIQISPQSAINPVGKNHVLTGHVNVNAGAGSFANAPSGTTITFSLLSGPASFVGPSSCQTAGGTGSCSVTIVSSTPGTSVIRAATNVTVGGVALSRATGDAKVGDSADASKLWADDAPRTDILNAAGAVITTAQAGTVVHDQVQVAALAGTPAGVPAPSGTVIFHRYTTINCTGTPTNQSVTLTPGAPSTAVSDSFAVTADMSYQAEYLGDANYPTHLAACEPLTVTPVPQPAIAIVKNPKGQTVAVGGTAKFSITVTNTGNTVLTDVNVTDPLSPNCNRTKAQIPALASMAPGAAVTYSCSRPSVQTAFDNVATATGTPPSGPNVTATDTAPVKVKPLTPKKVIKKKKPKVVTHKKPKATG